MQFYPSILKVRMHSDLPCPFFQRLTMQNFKNVNPLPWLKSAFCLLKKYAITVSRQVGIKGPHTSTGALGTQMTVDELNQFSETQLHQLFDLYTEATKIPEMKDDN